MDPAKVMMNSVGRRLQERIELENMINLGKMEKRKESTTNLEVGQDDAVPSAVVDMTVRNGKAESTLEDTTLWDLSPPLSRSVTTNGWNIPPIFMKKWHPDVNLLKEDVSTVPVWVKLHGVPVTDFSEDVLSAIATKLGTPLMLDSYTSDVCMQSWGRSSYTRAMIELRADMELKDNIVVAMPKITREGHYTCNIRV
ncbi:hypothetical protein Tco_0387153 [Tanacetum coccineum]